MGNLTNKTLFYLAKGDSNLDRIEMTKKVIQNKDSLSIQNFMESFITVELA